MNILRTKTNLAEYLHFSLTSKTGWTPLMMACSAGHNETVKLLVEMKCDVNAKNINGQTSLHYAASRNRFEVSETNLLIQ
jgi:ankyrin repeat protein